MRKRSHGAVNRPNLGDVGRRAGVSAMTVSRALSQPDKVSGETLALIHAAIDELGYLPNLAAETLRNNQSRVIVAMVPTINHSIFSDTVQGISDVLDEAGYRLLLGNSGYAPDKEEELVKTFLSHRPDGIILTGTLHTETARKFLKAAAIPVVEMWDIDPDRVDMAVGFDNFKVGHDLVRHLVDRGYRRLGYVSTTFEHEAREKRARLRSQGILSAIEEAGLPTPPRTSVPDPLNIEECGVIAADFIATNPGIDVAVCANEIIGVGALVDLQKRGWHVPDDIGIAAIGDANFAALAPPGLTTVRFHGYDIGRHAARLILSRLQDGSDETKCIDVGFEVIERGSTKFLQPEPD
ncbi:MAG: LacI family DNA-binding transcriptional regulator [Geminicoccaceae bacterium]